MRLLTAPLLWWWVLVCFPAKALHNLIELDVEVDEVEGAVLFSWERDDEDGPAMTLSRRIEGDVGAQTWNQLATLPRTTTSWTDSSVSSGVIYEYRFFIPPDEDFPNETAVYVSCGIEAPLVDSRGTVLLVVDETIAEELVGELKRFEMDLSGDGWNVERLDFARHGVGTPEDLRAAIQARNASTPLSSILLFGHLPIVTSGLIQPDEHELYRQATDLFYADLDGVWEDSLSTSFPDQQNFYPGDGHYDHATIPGPNFVTELPVGRIDFAGMDAWPLGEVELLRRYLEKNHNFRHLRYETPREGYFSSLSLDESPVEAASVVAMLGPENCVEAYDEFTEQSRPFLWGIAARHWNGAEYPNYEFKSQFTVNFASGKQAWEWDDNQMRAMLAMPWYGLTCFWGARPNWFFHHVGMGKSIGYSNMRTVNNNDNADPSFGHDYLPVDDFDEWLDGYVHLNLMGDPTLRVHPVATARNLTASLDDGGVRLEWEAAADGEVSSYHVYVSPSPRGPFERLTEVPWQALNFYHDVVPAATTYYMVRSVKLERSPVGSYWNAGQGVFVKVGVGGVNQSPIAENPVLSTQAGTPLSVTAAASDGDGDELVFTAAGNAANGEVTGVAPHFTYTPDPGFEGEDQFQFNVWDGTAESVGTVTVVVVGSAYDDWRETIEWGGADSSPSGDPNGNGVVNELEFHLGRDPLAEGSELFSRSEVVTQEGVSSYVLEFRRRRNDPALSLQISENSLDDWFDLEFDGVNIIEEVIAPDPLGDGSVEDVRVTLRLTNGPERCFVRFRVVAD